MNPETVAEGSGGDRCYRAFFDGASLAITFPSKPDYSYFSKLILYHIKQAETGDVRRVLLDCALLTNIDMSRLTHFLSLGLGLQRLGIELLLLDAPVHLQSHVKPLLPEACWIESTTGTPSPTRTHAAAHGRRLDEA